MDYTNGGLFNMITTRGRQFFRFVVLGILALSFVSGCASKRIGSGVALPTYKELKLNNGLTVLFFPDASLPYLSFFLLTKVGSGHDPEGQQGLTSVTASLLDKGTAKREALVIADALGRLGADFSASVGPDFTVSSLKGLSLHESALLDNFSEILIEPTFKEEEVVRLKSRRLSELRRLADNPKNLVSLGFESFLFGTHPYGHLPEGTIKGVTAVKRKNIIKHYLQYFRPNNSTVAVVGQYSPDFVNQFVAKFEKWDPRDVAPAPAVQAPAVGATEIMLMDKPKLEQAQLRLGHIGIKRAHPDYLKLRVANAILGDGLTSRLMTEIRVKRGLTYGIMSKFDVALTTGSFSIGTFTRLDKLGEMLTESQRVLKEFVDKGVTEKKV